MKNAKPIPLRNFDEPVWVDEEVFNEVIGMGQYFILRDAGTKKPVPYFDRKLGNNIQKIGLHRFLSRAPKGAIVLFLNNNSLDCTRENLLVCTPKQANILRKLLPLRKDSLKK